MPDASQRVALSAVRAAGRWCQRSVVGEVTLFVEADEVVVRVEANGEELPVALSALSGAAWAAPGMVLYREDEVLQLERGDGLDRAWHVLTLRTCALPEVTRGLRALGAAHGETAAEHARYFAPLLEARRRLEGDEPLDWRVAGFDAETLGARLRAAVSGMALDRHAVSAPHRRALEAGLLDANDAMFRQLDRVAHAARAVHDGADATRFVAWRDWVEELRQLFVHADRAWSAMASVLAEDPAPTRPPSR